MIVQGFVSIVSEDFFAGFLQKFLPENLQKIFQKCLRPCEYVLITPPPEGRPRILPEIPAMIPPKASATISGRMLSDITSMIL